MILVDKKCENCEFVKEDLFAGEDDICPKCGTKLKRIFGYKKYKEFIPAWFEHFDHEPIFIDSREQFKAECKKRNLVQKDGGGSYYKE